MHNEQHSRSDDGRSGFRTLSSPNRAPGAVAVHETIRKEGEVELSRSLSALLLSAIAAGLSMSFSLVSEGVLKSHLPCDELGFLVSSLGYTVGFIVVIMTHQQLLTENTVTAVLPAMSQPSIRSTWLLLRLWSVVLVGNLLGVATAVWAYLLLPIFSPDVLQAFADMGHEVLKNTPMELFAKGIMAGWMIAALVWMLPKSGSARLWLIIIVTYLVAIGQFSHIIAGSAEVLYLVFSGQADWTAFAWQFGLPTLGGNIVGGSLIFALISHAQIRSG